MMVYLRLHVSFQEEEEEEEEEEEGGEGKITSYLNYHTKIYFHKYRIFRRILFLNNHHNSHSLCVAEIKDLGSQITIKKNSLYKTFLSDKSRRNRHLELQPTVRYISMK
jgi:hypothetical protein